MIESLIIKMAIGSGVIIATFLFGYQKGKQSQKIKQLKSGIKDAVKTKKRRNNRRKSDITTVRRRMRRYTIG